MEECELQFESTILRRGFWIYVIQITDNDDGKKYYYVGMTGDSGSKNSASLFVRMGRHLENKGVNEKNEERAKGNTLWRAIKKKGIEKNKLNFQIIGFYLEEEKESRHGEIRRKISHIEDMLHKSLEIAVKGKHEVLGSQWKKQECKISEGYQKKYQEIVQKVRERFGVEI